MKFMFLLRYPGLMAAVISGILLSPLQAMAKEVVGIAEPWQLGFQESASPVMEQLADLHDYVLVIITVITIFVMLLLLYICIRFSRRNNPTPSKTTHNTLIEIIWTVVPVMILIAIAIPSLRLHYYMDRAADPEMTLKVTGYQWYWGYEYPDHDNLSFDAIIKSDDELEEGDVRLLSTDKPVVVPVNTTVRVLMTAADVIHAWAIPALGVKQDAVPGRLNETWFEATRTGIYYGQCSELCGIKHGFMPIELHVVEKDEFEAWVAQAKNGNYSVKNISRQSQSTASRQSLQQSR